MKFTGPFRVKLTGTTNGWKTIPLKRPYSLKSGVTYRIVFKEDLEEALVRKVRSDKGKKRR